MFPWKPIDFYLKHFFVQQIFDELFDVVVLKITLKNKDGFSGYLCRIVIFEEGIDLNNNCVFFVA